MGKYVLKSDGIRCRKSASQDVEKTAFFSFFILVIVFLHYVSLPGQSLYHVQ